MDRPTAARDARKAIDFLEKADAPSGTQAEIARLRGELGKAFKLVDKFQSAINPLWDSSSPQAEPLDNLNKELRVLTTNYAGDTGQVITGHTDVPTGMEDGGPGHNG